MAETDKKLKEITERLEQGVKEIFTSERYTEYLDTMSKFHNYSFNNTLLITMQKPDATLVAGYQAWQKKFNRHVKRGEKGIQIIAPTPVKEKQEIEKIDPDTQEPIIGEDGQPETEIVESIIWYSTKVAFLFSLTIEFLQLFLRLGTFQLSDLCYNTFGGAIGGVLYWMGWKVKKE